MSYIITEATLALIPKNNRTRVFELEHTLVLNEETPDVVDRNCCINGSTLAGRQRGSAYLIGSNYKPPIVIDELKKLILIPTHSVRNTKCSWLMLNNILNYTRTENNTVNVEFINHKKITINISFSKFDKQVLRATRLESSLRGRNSKKYL